LEEEHYTKGKQERRKVGILTWGGNRDQRFRESSRKTKKKGEIDSGRGKEKFSSKKGRVED